MSQKLHIEIISDHVCPWCFVGKRRLEKALEMCPDIEAEVSWQPFQLSPDLPREGVKRSDYYREKFGEERAAQIANSMQDTGVEEGIAFGSSPDAMSPNTLAAHTLMLWASEAPNIDVNALAEALFVAHHVECADLGDHDVLTRIAAGAGMDEASVREGLAAAKDEGRVQELIKQSASRGVSGVPFFIINDRYGLSGAQPADTLVDAFRQILAD
jgi:predicted DsbA family dithiol-disulfide isomerase